MANISAGSVKHDGYRLNYTRCTALLTRQKTDSGVAFPDFGGFSLACPEFAFLTVFFRHDVRISCRKFRIFSQSAEIEPIMACIPLCVKFEPVIPARHSRLQGFRRFAQKALWLIFYAEHGIFCFLISPCHANLPSLPEYLARKTIRNIDETVDQEKWGRCVDFRKDSRKSSIRE